MRQREKSGLALVLVLFSMAALFSIASLVISVNYRVAARNRMLTAELQKRAAAVAAHYVPAQQSDGAKLK